ncbi:MAG: glycoside hydrolase family 172 protein, partial [Myxococcota bacterium]
ERQRASAPYQLLAPGASLDLLDVQGAGRVVSMWVTFSVVDGDAHSALREPSLSMWWDGAAEPAVQVPLGDFFALGHGEPGEVVSLPVVASLTGLSCRWTMPFADGARVRITNDGPHELRVYWQVDWERIPAEDVGPYRFQAAWRREPATERGRDFLVADLRGEGNYVGTVLAVDPREPEWWGEGDDLVWIDGAAAPTLLGTGTEDFVHQAWGLRPMSAPFSGVVDGKGRHTTIYRWHVSDPIPFRSSFRMVMQQHAKGSVPRSDDVSATSFWYQRPPLSPVAPLPPADARLPAPGVPKDAWRVRGEVVPVDLAGLADASRFGDGRCGPRSPHPLFDVPGAQTVAGVPVTLLSACDGDASSLLLGPAERARLALPAGGDTLYLYVAANGARGADALTVTGEGWTRT